MAKNIPTPNDILEMIEHDYNTKKMMADEFECSISTIEDRLRTLREDGHAIIHNGNGLKAITKDIIENNKEDARTLEMVVDWYLGSIKGLARLMMPNKPCLPAMKRCLGNNLSKDERRELARACARTNALLMYIEAEDDME